MALPHQFRARFAALLTPSARQPNWTARRGCRLLLAALLFLGWSLPGVARAAPADATAGALAFYTQAGGGGGLGFVVADGPAGRFWTSFKALGGVGALGYPASSLYASDGFTYQAVQGALLQWRPELGRAVLANTFEQFSQAGLDQQLLTARQIPLPIADDGSGGDYQKAVATRLGWLTDPGIKARYLANPDPATIKTWGVDDAIARYGLPMSKPQAFGPFVAQRFQRIAFQRWTKAVPGMPAPGAVVRVLGGDLAKETGLVPQQAQQPRPAPPAGSTGSQAQGPVVTDAGAPDSGPAAPPPTPMAPPPENKPVKSKGEPTPTAAQESFDLLRNVPVVDEKVLNKDACGQAAATMLLDYLAARTGTAPPDLRSVARYVPQWYWAGTTRAGGTTFPQLLDGMQEAAAAFGVPLTVRWERLANPADWAGTLAAELMAGRPVIVFLADGGMLWNGDWHDGHFVVVSGVTDTGAVIYHDPWDGKAHIVDAATFQAAWGQGGGDNPPWSFLRASPQGVSPPPAPAVGSMESRGATFGSPTAPLLARVVGSGFIPGEQISLDATFAPSYIVKGSAAPTTCRTDGIALTPDHTTASQWGGFWADVQAKDAPHTGGMFQIQAVGSRSGISTALTITSGQAATVSKLPAGC